MSSPEKNDDSQSWLRHGSKGFELAAAVAGFMFVGRWVGGYYGNARLGIRHRSGSGNRRRYV